MKKKHEIKTIEDIKYCEENGLTIYSTHTEYHFEFEDGKWNAYDEDDKLRYYDYGLDFIEDLYYYEEQEQEVTTSDIGKLFKFWDYDEENEYKIAILKGIVNNSNGETVYYDNIYGECCWKNCRRLTPSEVAEMTGYKVEEK